jgi:hypothetical protein
VADGEAVALGNKGHDTRALQAYSGQQQFRTMSGALKIADKVTVTMKRSATRFA